MSQVDEDVDARAGDVVGAVAGVPQLGGVCCGDILALGGQVSASTTASATAAATAAGNELWGRPKSRGSSSSNS